MILLSKIAKRNGGRRIARKLRDWYPGAIYHIMHRGVRYLGADPMKYPHEIPYCKPFYVYLSLMPVTKSPGSEKIKIQNNL